MPCFLACLAAAAPLAVICFSRPNLLITSVVNPFPVLSLSISSFLPKRDSLVVSISLAALAASSKGDASCFNPGICLTKLDIP